MDKKELDMLRALPLDIKIAKSKLRIEEFVRYMGQENVYISFSGGKDSTVLLHLVRSLYPDLPAVFSNTGLEFPEVVDFAKFERVYTKKESFEVLAEKYNTTVKTLQKINKVESADELENDHFGNFLVRLPRKNVIELRPKKTFKQVIEEDGYPMISKLTARMIHDCQNPTDKNLRTRTLYMSDYYIDEVTGLPDPTRKNPRFKIPQKWRYLVNSEYKFSNKCCAYLKHRPIADYEKESKKRPIVGTMAAESKMRETSYLKSGCNQFLPKKEICAPLGFWSESDILEYLKVFNLEYASVYGDIVETGREVYGRKELTTTGEKRTGCVFCGFGVHLEKGENRYQRLQRTHPQLHSYCMNNLGFKGVCELMGIEHSLKEE